MHISPLITIPALCAAAFCACQMVPDIYRNNNAFQPTPAPARETNAGEKAAPEKNAAIKSAEVIGLFETYTQDGTTARVIRTDAGERYVYSYELDPRENAIFADQMVVVTGEIDYDYERLAADGPDRKTLPLPHFSRVDSIEKR